MAYSLPVFNLTCNIYRAGSPTTPAVVSLCNLALGRRVNVQSTGGTTTIGIPLLLMWLLLPKLTDIRSSIPPFSTTFAMADQVEVPAGSGRYYQVAYVDDIGKGFSNEHRFAIIEAIARPYPLP